MAEVTMPRLSDTMTEGTIARWVKQEGEQIKKGDILAEIETDKATMELESYENGVLEQLMVQPGQTVAIGAPIARIGSGDGANAKANGGATAPATEEAPAETAEQPSDAGRPEARRRAEPEGDADADARNQGGGAVTTEVPAPGDEGRAAEPTTGEGASQPGRAGDVETVQDSDGTKPTGDAARPRQGAGGGAAQPVAERAPDRDGEEDGVRASPMARRIARERGIDLHTIRGSGPGGRIIRADIETAEDGAGAAPAPAQTAETLAASGQPAQQPAQPRPAPAAADQEVEEIPLSNIRRVTGRRMVESVQTAPHFFLTSVVDVTELVALRRQINERLEAAGDDTKVSVNDFIVKACGVALRQMPDVNVSFDGDKLLRKKRIHIGIAVALDNGLIVPVVRDVDQKSVGQVARESKALIDKARAGKLQPADYTGGTFTVSNLGMFGIEHFTAVINTPEAAILAVGAVAAEPVVVDGKVEVRERMRCTLSVDHRALDGANGARFLQVLRGILEAPMRILV